MDDSSPFNPAPTAKFLFSLRAGAMERYRSSLTGEKIGWVVFLSPLSFCPVHKILMDPERGPVIVVGTDVFEIDENTPDTYTTESAAQEAYFNRKD